MTAAMLTALAAACTWATLAGLTGRMWGWFR